MLKVINDSLELVLNYAHNDGVVNDWSIERTLWL